MSPPRQLRLRAECARRLGRSGLECHAGVIVELDRHGKFVNPDLFLDTRLHDLLRWARTDAGRIIILLVKRSLLATGCGAALNTSTSFWRI